MMTNTGSLKKSNMLNVIQIIKEKGSITKPDIAALTGLTSASIHNFIQELSEKQIVLEEGVNVSNGGRKALLYRFNAKIRYIIGVYIALTNITACVYDLDFNEKTKSVRPIDLAANEVEYSIKCVIEEIEKAIITAGISPQSIAGVGITVPGPVNYEEGVVNKVVNAPNWKNIPLKSMIEKAIKLHVVVDKETSGIVLYDKWFHAEEKTRNLVHITITNGVGSGILINRQLYRGEHNIAGEIGHMCVNPNGGVCNCGNIGCIELYADNPHIMGIVKSKLKEGEQSSLSNINHISMEDILTAAAEKDLLATSVFRQASDYLVLVLGNIIKMFDPDEIIFDCYWLYKLPDMFSYIINKVFINNKMIDRTDIKINVEQIEDLFLKGSATLIYDELFNSYQTCTFL